MRSTGTNFLFVVVVVVVVVVFLELLFSAKPGVSDSLPEPLNF
jgi:uncharacterized membrane protein YqiK